MALYDAKIEKYCKKVEQIQNMKARGMTDDEIDDLGKGGNDGKYEDQMSFYSEEDDDENKNT